MKRSFPINQPCGYLEPARFRRPPLFFEITGLRQPHSKDSWRIAPLSKKQHDYRRKQNRLLGQPGSPLRLGRMDDLRKRKQWFVLSLRPLLSSDSRLRTAPCPASWPRRDACYNAPQSAAQGRLGARATSHIVRQMRKRDLLHALVGCFLAVVAFPCLAQDDEIRWLDNYHEAIQEAQRTQKPIFLEFRCEP